MDHEPDGRGTMRGVVGLLMVLVLCGGLRGQEPGGEVVVGVKEAAPFAFRDGDQWSGIAVELWRDVGSELGVRTRFEPCTLDELFAGVRAGRFDAGIGALTVTAEREESMDFGQPFYESGLGIAAATEGGSGWTAVMDRLVSKEFLALVGGLVALLFLAGFLVWMFERRGNRDQFGGGPSKGLGEGFWWAAVTMTTVGYGDRAPQSVGGRVVALIWMFSSLISISFFTAAIASQLTLSNLRGAVQGPEDLARARVATVASSTSSRWLDRRGLSSVRHPDLAAALDALERGDADAVVYDAPLLRFAIRREHAATVTVLPHRLERQAYAFVFPENSTMRERVNRVTLKRGESESWTQLVRRYLGE